MDKQKLAHLLQQASARSRRSAYCQDAGCPCLSYVQYIKSMGTASPPVVHSVPTCYFFVLDNTLQTTVSL